VCIEELAKVHSDEVQTDGNVIWITRKGILNHSQRDENFQMDFKLPKDKQCPLIMTNGPYTKCNP
jgi:hypothetical protein